MTYRDDEGHREYDRSDDWEDEYYRAREYATDPGEPPPPDEPPTDRERPRPRRWVTALALLTVFVLGVLGGVIADRYLAVGCRTCAPPPGTGVPLVGTLESTADGLIAVRTPEGRLVPVRTSPATRVVDQQQRPGPVTGLVRGTRVSVLGVPDADGVLTADAVGVPGS
ncbi:hypothetical protein EV188_102344 [Actinomycetospora succinea]|uniref:DUF5666 domain-containing protein n=1 Tax=Actinomycetospora succinea TaxID=663603 RepID=A0A4R6VLC9_9PSEU|nr:hypothetical protein [Actinomycetospora succinea]TDQ62689.1 hypothetical protein EV188_102344 [Actinomycetospora succinea]